MNKPPADDFQRIAAILREDAVVSKNSHWNQRWGWTPPSRKDEYDELSRLATAASNMASQLRREPKSRQRAIGIVKAKRDRWQRQADIYEAAEHDSVFAFIKFVAAANEILAELERD